MRRALRGGIARLPEGPGKCRRGGISAQRSGRDVCPWLCRPRPSRRRPAFPGGRSGTTCDRRWRLYRSLAGHLTLAPPSSHARTGARESIYEQRGTEGVTCCLTVYIALALPVSVLNRWVVLIA